MQRVPGQQEIHHSISYAFDGIYPALDRQLGDNLRLLIAIAVVLAINYGWCHSSSATTIQTTGAIAVIASPSSVVDGALRSDLTVKLFAEVHAKSLPVPLAVDVFSPGAYPTGIPLSLSPGTIPQGTIVNSYYVHADSISSFSGNPVVFDGTITFDVPVLGIDVLSASLDDGINLLGLPTVSYPVGVANSGLEVVGAGAGFAADTFILSADRKTVTIHLQTVGTTDQMRIVTAVPEPASLALLGAGGLALLAKVWRYRRR